MIRSEGTETTLLNRHAAIMSFQLFSCKFTAEILSQWEETNTRNIVNTNNGVLWSFTMKFFVA